ncbi:dicarboxylate/amino acid:cation symporter [Marinicella rhabdoformis]|uniref:dicarboxylate/amino acid:cation symporter n=1 Tax=Marinicella rhabdoformis TaxID=2580566 RepID=UPI0012AEB6FD|nr:dicarboxylate/amino acid:cation symporter [Marinicella rhabdoformis]
MTLTKKIIIFMIAGAALGLILNITELNQNVQVDTYLTGGLFHVIGQLFIKALKMMVVPLVFVSLFCGTTALREPAMLGSLGGRTLGFYLLTTAIALVVALSFAMLIGVGVGSEIPTSIAYQAKADKPLMDVVLDIIPSNPIMAMAEGNMLAVIVFAILLGLSATQAGKAGDKVIEFFQAFNEVVMKLVMMIMNFAPYAVFAILAKVFAQLGIDAIQTLAGYFFTVLGLLIFHALVVYPIILKLFSGLNPLTFIKKMESAVSFAFGTSSSNATIPVTLRTVTERLGVNKSVASFTIPFGATINMDGTAIMQGVATVFIANAYGVDLTTTQLLTVVLMATMASVGSAGVPSAGLVMLQGVLLQVGLPIEGIGIILGIDRLLDMTRTAVNITGDAAVTCIVAKSQGQFDESIFNDPHAGEIKSTS